MISKICYYVFCVLSVSACAKPDSQLEQANVLLTAEANDLFQQIEGATKDVHFAPRLASLEANSPMDLLRVTSAALTDAPMKFGGQTFTNLKTSMADIADNKEVAAFYKKHASFSDLFHSLKLADGAPTLEHVQRSLKMVAGSLQGETTGSSADGALALKVSLYLLLSQHKAPSSGLVDLALADPISFLGVNLGDYVAGGAGTQMAFAACSAAKAAFQKCSKEEKRQYVANEMHNPTMVSGPKCVPTPGLRRVEKVRTETFTYDNCGTLVSRTVTESETQHFQ